MNRILASLVAMAITPTFLWAKTCDPSVLAGLVAQSRLVSTRPVDVDRLKRQGFRDGYIGGLDALGGMFRAAGFLRSPGVDPARTHVDDFAFHLDRQFAFIEEGIRSQMGPLNARILWDGGRLGLLEAFRAEARGFVERGELSYRRWLNLHLRLSLLATSKRERQIVIDAGDFLAGDLYKTDDWHTDGRLEAAYGRWESHRHTSFAPWRFVEEFPEIVLVPTVGDLGVGVFNRLFMTGIHPVGVAGATVHADGGEMSPYFFLRHDYLHLRSVIRWEKNLFVVRNQRESQANVDDVARRILRFHNAFLDRAETLPPQEQKMAELMYFLATYDRLSGGKGYTKLALERPVEAYELFSGYDMSNMARDFKGSRLLPDDIDGNSVEAIYGYLSEALDLFNRIASEIRAD